MNPETLSASFAYPRAVLDYLATTVFRDGAQVVDLGCGSRKYEGACGVDFHPTPVVDVVHDLDATPYPFADAEFDVAILRHVIEHLADPTRTMAEVARILRPGGHAIVMTPHFSDASSWIDPAHRWHLATRSMEEAGAGLLRHRMIYVKLRKRWRRLGVERLINAQPVLDRVPRRLVSWENDWCFIVRGGEMLVVLQRPPAR